MAGGSELPRLSRISAVSRLDLAVWVQYEAGGGSRATRSRVAAADCSSASLSNNVMAEE